MLKSALIAIVICCSVAVSHVEAQRHLVRDYFRDYVCQVPRAFSPDDPWTMGKIMRTEVGFGGFFFNCDYDQNKRYSPYIDWYCQNPECKRCRPVRNTIHQQWEEIKQRIRWGSCNECDTDIAGGCQAGGVGCESAQSTPALKNVDQFQAANARWSPPAQINPGVANTASVARPSKSDSRALIASLLDEARLEQKANVPVPVNRNPLQQSQSNRQMVAGLLREARKEQAQNETLISQPTTTPIGSDSRSKGALVDLLRKRRAQPDNAQGMGVPQPVQANAKSIIPNGSSRDDGSNRTSVANRPTESNSAADENFRMIRR